MPEDRSRFPSAHDRARSRDVGMPPQQEAPVSARIRTLIFDALGGNSPDMAKRRRAMQAADMLTGAGAEFAVGMTPVLGDAQAMYEAKQAYEQGDMGRAAFLGGLAAVGMVPVVGDIAKKGGDLAMDTASRMARASDQGFAENVFHVSRMGDDISEFNKGNDAVSPFDAIGVHVGTKDAANYRFESANKYRHPEDKAGVMYPLTIRKERLFLNKDGQPWNEEELSDLLNQYQFSQGLSLSDSKDGLRDFIWAKFDAIPYINDVESKGSISYIVPPSNIRSVNAAFDPAKRGSANLLAGGAAAAVGVGAMTRAQQDEQNRRNQ